MDYVHRQRSSHPLTEFCFFLSLIFDIEGEFFFYSSLGCNRAYRGFTYLGSVNSTSEGKACRPWASANALDLFSDGSIEEADNFCRNPLLPIFGGVYCLRLDDKSNFGFCDTCPGGYEGYNACSLSDKGASYKGNLARTKSHIDCEPWIKHRSKDFKFPDGSAEKANNYCRNPDPNVHEAPWCYIAGVSNKPWEYCDVCKPFLGKVTRMAGKPSAVSYTISEMSRPACVHWCITEGWCAGVAVPKAGMGCQYYFRNDGQMSNDNNFEYYAVTRVCSHAAEGKETGKNGYFARAHSVKIDGNNAMSSEEMPTEELCQDACLSKTTCALYEYNFETNECALYNMDVLWRYEYDKSESSLIGAAIICDRSLDGSSNENSTYSEIIEQYKFVIAGAGAVIVAVVGVVVYFKCVRKKGKSMGKGKKKGKHKGKGKKKGSKEKRRKSKRKRRSRKQKTQMPYYYYHTAGY